MNTNNILNIVVANYKYLLEILLLSETVHNNNNQDISEICIERSGTISLAWQVSGGFFFLKSCKYRKVLWDRY